MTNVQTPPPRASFDAILTEPLDARTSWIEFNQHALTREIARVRDSVASYVGDEPPHDARDEWNAAESTAQGTSASWDHNEPSALDTVTRVFGLSAFERDILVLCAGVELDARVASLFGTASALGTPSFSLALASLSEPHWSALTPAAPLRAWRLVELIGPAISTAQLRIDERILHFLTGINQFDERLRGMLDRIDSPERDGLADSATALRIGEQLRASDMSVLVQITGGTAASRRATSVAAAASLGVATLRLRVEDIPAVSSERFDLSRLLAREAVLMHAIIIAEPQSEADGVRVSALAESLQAPLLVCTNDSIGSLAGRVATFEIATTTRDAKLAMLQTMLGAHADSLNGALPRICAQFELSPAGARAVADVVRSMPRDTPQNLRADALWDACRRVTRPRMESLAQRIEAVADWSDLILPEPQLGVLRDIATHVRQRDRVYEEWGFAQKSARGLGISALFAGPSGTGKTTAAEVLARELRLDLYRVDLAGVVSKYIGETEKNFNRLFAAAEGSGAILLFDEADALFGKRSDVKDSHDRYANIEISYLLQRMESYRGLTILTSNMKQALDPAFLRRIRFIAHFPFPTAESREAIWRGVFPASTPTVGLDYARLAQLSLAGGHIRNIALAAAFIAADAGERVSMRHLAKAARAECAKLERSASDAELRGWV